MKVAIYLSIAVAFAFAITPHFNEAIGNAASSWPVNSPVDASFLALIPSPMGLVFAFLLATSLVLLIKVFEST